MTAFFLAHITVFALAAFWIFVAAVQAMPDPTSSSSTFYKWSFTFLHLLGADLQGAFGSKLPPAPAAVSQKGSARFGVVMLACTLSICVVVAGCTIPAWVKDIEAEMPTIIDAIGDLLPILQVLNVSPVAINDIEKAQTDLTAANTLAKGFQSGSTAPLAQVQALLADAQTNISSVDQFVPADSQGLVATLLQDATNEVNTIAADTQQTAAAGRFAATPAKKPLGRSAFVKTWNSHIRKTGNPAVDEVASKLKLDEHGRFVHLVTLYRVK